MATLPQMTETDLERRLREAGGEFIESHRRTESAIREAVEAGLPTESLVQVSGLSRPTIDAFLGQLGSPPESPRTY